MVKQKRISLISQVEATRPIDSKEKVDSLIALLQERNSVLDYYWDKLIRSFIDDPSVLEYYKTKKSLLKFSNSPTEAFPSFSDILVSLYPVDNVEKVERLYKELRESDYPITRNDEAIVYSKIKGVDTQKRWKEIYEGGKEIKIEVKNIGAHKVAVVPQPLATFLVFGLLDEISISNYYTLHQNEVIYVYATEFSSDMMYRVQNNKELFGRFCNAMNTGSIEIKDYYEKCFVGKFRIGKKISKGVEEIVFPSIFNNPVVSDINQNPEQLRHTAYIPELKHLELVGRTIIIPTNEEIWNQLEEQNGFSLYHWEKSFDNFIKDKDLEEYLSVMFDYDEDEEDHNGLLEGMAGDENGLFDLLFVYKDKRKTFHQKNEGAIKKKLLNTTYGEMFTGLVINFEKLIAADKGDSSFDILQQRDWILDWNCVTFKQGYFIVTEPIDGNLRFKPETVSAPGVVESYNYLKDYLNDRLPPIHCSVETMKLTIYDTIRLNEVVEKLASISRQQRIITTNPVIRRLAPTQMSFSQALSKAQQMTPDEFRKYKSKYIDHLVKLQSEKYKIIPCAERMAYSDSDIIEYAFIFTVEGYSDNILIIHENVNPARATLLFVVKKNKYERAIRAIYDFLQSPEINKRSSLRDKTVDIEEANIRRYRSINHDFLLSWQNVISSYRRF